MGLAVCLLFDARSDLLMRQLWSRLEDAGVSTLATHTHGRHYPHLSYAVLRSWDLERAQEAIAALPAAEPAQLAHQQPNHQDDHEQQDERVLPVRPRQDRQHRGTQVERVLPWGRR